MSNCYENLKYNKPDIVPSLSRHFNVVFLGRDTLLCTDNLQSVTQAIMIARYWIMNWKDVERKGHGLL
jgi:hypothetical protein